MSQLLHPPLPVPTNRWRSRWLLLPVGLDLDRLHRVSTIVWENDQWIRGVGTTVCGRQGPLQMPGIISRTWLTRCRRCCELLGIPGGIGVPFDPDVPDDGL